SAEECRGEYQAGGVVALAFDEPGVVGLVGIAFVFWQAVAVVIVLVEIGDGFLHGGPGVTQESLILVTCEDKIAIDHQDELGIEIFPTVGVLPAKLIDLLEGI